MAKVRGGHSVAPLRHGGAVSPILVLRHDANLDCDITDCDSTTTTTTAPATPSPTTAADGSCSPPPIAQPRPQRVEHSCLPTGSGFLHNNHVAMSPRRVQSKEAATRWAVLIIPLILLGAFGFGTWAIIDHLCGMSSISSAQTVRR